MFTTDGLHLIRSHELDIIVRYLPSPGSSLLELGAGTGHQALTLKERGFLVTAVDIPQSSYRGQRVFPVQDYDGKRLPFDDKSFDVVFSSNALEHVANLSEILAETRRVLKPGGFAVHVLPTATWRLWTSVTGMLDTLPFAAAWAKAKLEGEPSPLRSLARGIAVRLAPTAHGARGTAFSELITFRGKSWGTIFVENGFDVLTAEAMSLFYTGWSLLGRQLSLEARGRLADWLGSSCRIYKIRPMNP